VNNFQVANLAHKQIGEWAGVPAKYYERMKAEAPALLARNVNHHRPTGCRAQRTTVRERGVQGLARNCAQARWLGARVKAPAAARAGIADEAGRHLRAGGCAKSESHFDLLSVPAVDETLAALR
jgi:hypothetical protein